MKKVVFLSLLFYSSISIAQKGAPVDWQLLSPKADKVYGMSVEEAYKMLEGKESKQVIVAVIDSGTEIDHEDLKDVIWTNTDEIPNNGIDDDNNGYIDDVNGWSFLGGKEEDINYESLELARLYFNMSKKFGVMDTLALSKDDQKEFEEFKKIRQEYKQEELEQKQQLMGLQLFSKLIENIKSSNNGELTKKAIKKYTPKDPIEKKLRKRLKMLVSLGVSPEELEGQLKESEESIENTLKYNSQNSDSIRQVIVGDDLSDLTNRFYGCNRVEGPDAAHGTHVAGIIAASRNNSKGMKGVASNVLIMPVRAVPNGDERDKDVANAIYYAVDNGASIINMSFGKYYSPDKKLVDDAIEYAKSKDVLLVHAAGNDAKNNNVEISFPNRNLLSGNSTNNWIQVGANAYKSNKKIIASFSNYGSKEVDLFAPGVDIYSTITDNKYARFSGTSMASPSVAGAAAILRSYFPELSAHEVREVLMRSVVKYKKAVKIPGVRKGKVKVSDLCISGGFVSVENAVEELLSKKAIN